MNETCMDNGHSRIVELKEVDWSALSPQGLKLFIKYEDMELHLGSCVSRREINRMINQGHTRADAYTANMRFDSSKAMRHV